VKYRDLDKTIFETPSRSKAMSDEESEECSEGEDGEEDEEDELEDDRDDNVDIEEVKAHDGGAFEVASEADLSAAALRDMLSDKAVALSHSKTAVPSIPEAQCAKDGPVSWTFDM
jgi:hypothetical protein